MHTFGRWLLLLGLGGLGFLSLKHRDFALVWQPVPEGVPFRAVLACVSGAILLGGAIGLGIPRFRTGAAILLAVFATVWLLLLQLPRVAVHPLDVGIWLGFGETTILVAGTWTLAATLAGAPRLPAWIKPAARIGYGLLLPLIGLSHFVYVDATAGFVPAWLPFRRFFAYLTGAGHMAAGIGLLSGVLARIAAIAEAGMLSTFVLLVHIPGVLAAPADRMQWTMLCVASAYSGSAWIIAAACAPARRAAPVPVTA